MNEQVNTAVEPTVIAWIRLTLTLSISLLLHLALIFGFSLKLNSADVTGGSFIQARFESPTEVIIVKAKQLAPQQKTNPEKNKPQEAKEKHTLPVPLLTDEDYYSAKDLDVRPKPLEEIEFPYPILAEAQNIRGKVKIQVLISETGTVKDAKVLEALPAGYFEESTVKTFQKVKFSPGQKNQQLVKSRMVYEIDYDVAKSRK
jgi:TonB family protein